MMAFYQCYYLDGPREGETNFSENKPHEGKELLNFTGSPNYQPHLASEHQVYFRYLINRQEGTYCVASQFNHLDSEYKALEKAKLAGLQPF